MCMRNARIIRIRRIVQTPIKRIPLDERRVRHAWVVEHEVAPLQTDEVEGRGWVGGEDVGLEFEAGDEGGDGILGFHGGCTVGAPAGAQGGGD